MKFLYQIHNVGIYLYEDNDNWNNLIEANLKEQFDGFEIYREIMPVEFKLIIKNIRELDERNDAIVVPECSNYYDDGTMRSAYVNIAYKIEKKIVTMWTANETWYTPYLLEILFQQQDITFIHGAGVSVDKKEGKLLLAFGGIGKTCFIANAAKKERVSILGDDLILVSKSGELYSYPRPFCLYEYHKQLFPQYFNTHRVKYVHIEKDMYVKRIIRGLKKLLHIVDSNVYSFVPVSPVRLFCADKIQKDPVMVTDNYILRRNQNYTQVAISESKQASEAANFALNVILHEWDIGLKVILNKHAQEFCNFNEYYKPRYEILFAAFSKAKNIYCVDIPEKLSANDVSRELNKTILKGIE